jgi:hypothetical protein
MGVFLYLALPPLMVSEPSGSEAAWGPIDRCCQGLEEP